MGQCMDTITKLMDCVKYEEYERIINNLNNINIVDKKWGYNALHLVVMQWNSRLSCPERIKVIKLLISKKINVNAITKKDDSVFSLLFSNLSGLPNNYGVEAAKLLIDAGTNVNRLDNCRMNILHRVFKYELEMFGDYIVEIAKLLINAGVNIHAIDNVGFRPIDYLNTFSESRIKIELMYLLDPYFDISISKIEYLEKLEIQLKTLQSSLKYKNNKIKEIAISLNETCCVCLNDYKDMKVDDIHIYNCGHLICVDCFKIISSDPCPTCRQK